MHAHKDSDERNVRPRPACVLPQRRKYLVTNDAGESSQRSEPSGILMFSLKGREACPARRVMETRAHCRLKAQLKAHGGPTSDKWLEINLCCDYSRDEIKRKRPRKPNKTEASARTLGAMRGVHFSTSVFIASFISLSRFFRKRGGMTKGHRELVKRSRDLKMSGRGLWESKWTVVWTVLSGKCVPW